MPLSACPEASPQNFKFTEHQPLFVSFTPMLSISVASSAPPRIIGRMAVSMRQEPDRDPAKLSASGPSCSCTQQGGNRKGKPGEHIVTLAQNCRCMMTQTQTRHVPVRKDPSHTADSHAASAMTVAELANHAPLQLAIVSSRFQGLDPVRRPIPRLR